MIQTMLKKKILVGGVQIYEGGSIPLADLGRGVQNR